MGFTLVLCEASYILNYIILIINLKKTNTMKTTENKETLHGQEYGRMTDTHMHTDGHFYYIYLNDSVTIQININYLKGYLKVYKIIDQGSSNEHKEEVSVTHFQQIGDYDYATKNGVKSFRELECEFTCTIM